ncbi:MAG: hypothetical protein V9E88_10485 [Ferruginibacter sp.]
MPSPDKLFEARKNYQQEIIREHFDFTAFGKMANAIIYWNRENHYFSTHTDSWVEEIATIMKNLLRHGNTFCDSIEQYHSAWYIARRKCRPGRQNPESCILV